jgi:hypothetical protein
MDSELALKGKFTFEVGGRKLILVKKPVESLNHVVMKALLWALYLPVYPRLQVEVGIGAKYKPDLVQTDAQTIVFWAEAGSVGTRKLTYLLKRYPATHLVWATWNQSLAPLATRVERRRKGLNRRAPLDLIRFPGDADRRFIDRRGAIGIRHADLDWRRLT